MVLSTYASRFLLSGACQLTVFQYVEHMIKYASGGKESFKGKRVAVSGSGNVAQYAALKAIELGATVVSLSDSKGCIVSTGEHGITPVHVETIAQLKVERKFLSEIAQTDAFKDKFTYIDGARPWIHVGKIDIALPSATQNEVSGEEAKALIDAGTKFIAEGSNMGCSPEAIDIFEEHRRANKGEAIWYAPGKSPTSPSSSPYPIRRHSLRPPSWWTLTDPLFSIGKAANAGGVAVSGLEMAQNSQRISWTCEEVDGKLKNIMENCFTNGLETAKQYIEPKDGEFPSLVAGSNIAGFIKVSRAMKDIGDWW